MAAGDLTTLANLKSYLKMPCLAQATGSVALSGVAAGHALTFEGVGVTLTADTDFDVGANDTATATALAAAINAEASLLQLVTAESDGAEVDWTAVTPGAIGNCIIVSSSDSEFTITPMSGGAGIETNQEAVEDAALTRLITSSSTWFKGQVGWDILQASCSDVFSWEFSPRTAWDRAEFVLYTPHVTAISGVEIDDQAITESTGDAGWLLREDTLEIVNWGELDLPARESRSRRIEVSYTAGYATVPADVEQAVIEVAADAYYRRNRLGQRSGTKPGGETVTYLVDQVLPSVQSVIDIYKVPQRM